jgi:5-deoxy-glucuronate isomerase
MHIPQYNNNNKAIVDCNNDIVPLCYFSIIKLRAGESYSYQLDDYETCIVPATGSIDVKVQNQTFKEVGKRLHIWEGEPEGVYIPVNCEATLSCISEEVEVFISGAKYNKTHKAFVIREEDIDTVQYGSDDTKTHRKIKHILGKDTSGKVGRLLVSELFTVGAGGWSGFPPHKHETDMLPEESRHNEVYNFRFNPSNGFGAQFLTPDGDEYGPVYHVRNGSTFIFDKGYHPCVVAPGFEMYYFTILAGETQRPLHMNFHKDYAYQLESIPGMQDMLSKFK